MLSLSKSCCRAAAIVGIAVLAACASTDYHYSQLSAVIDAALGKNLVVQGPPGGALHLGEQREISLDVRPCTRYYLVAVRANKLASDFDVRIDYEEPVGGCTPPSEQRQGVSGAAVS